MSPKPKEMVSIVGNFKNSKAQDKSNWKKPRHHPKEPKLEHVLAQQFSQSIERSAEAIFEDAVGSAERTQGKFINDIAAAENALKTEQSRHAGCIQSLTKPFPSEPLIINETCGKRFEISIGERMDAFKARSARLEQRLAGLWTEWEAIQNQICTFGGEMLRLHGADGGGTVAAGLLHDESEEMSRKLATEKAKLGEEIESMCQEAVKRMWDHEKELSVATRKKQQDILDMLEVDM